MAKSGENPFRSGHTAALDIDQLEKDQVDDGWPTKPKKSKWASNEWGGGGEAWPSDFGGGSPGTAALDISGLDGLEDDEGSSRGRGKDKDKGRRLDPIDEDDWGDRDDRRKGSSGSKPRPTSDFADFGGASNTLSIDVEEMEQRAEPFSVNRRAERSEDARNKHTHDDQRGKRSYVGGQGDPARRDEKITRGKGRSYNPRGDDLDDLDDMDPPDKKGDNNLMPHERTMAIPMDQIAKGPPMPRPAPSSPLRPNSVIVEEDDELHRTEALDLESLRRKLPEVNDLAPHERTQAFDLQAIEEDEETTEQPLTPPSSPMRRMTSPSPSVTGGNARTTVIDQKDIENMRLNEADSGGRLLIFVPGTAAVLFDLRPGVTNVGRERTNHLVLSDPFSSRKHLRLKKQGDDFVVRDNDSDNGTLLNSRPLPGQTDQILKHGDDILIGSTVMRFILGQPRAKDYEPPVLPPPAELAPPPPPPMDFPPMPPMTPMDDTSSKSSSLIPIIVLVVFALGSLVLIGLGLVLFLW